VAAMTAEYWRSRRAARVRATRAMEATEHAAQN